MLNNDIQTVGILPGNEHLCEIVHPIAYNTQGWRQPFDQ